MTLYKGIDLDDVVELARENETVRSVLDQLIEIYLLSAENLNKDEEKPMTFRMPKFKSKQEEQEYIRRFMNTYYN